MGYLTLPSGDPVALQEQGCMLTAGDWLICVMRLHNHLVTNEARWLAAYGPAATGDLVGRTIVYGDAQDALDALIANYEEVAEALDPRAKVKL